MLDIPKFAAQLNSYVHVLPSFTVGQTCFMLEKSENFSVYILGLFSTPSNSGGLFRPFLLPNIQQEKSSCQKKRAKGKD